MSKAVIEVGANVGKDTVRLAKKYKEATVYAIEPTPKLYKDLIEKFKQNPQVAVFQLAVDEENGTATFNIAGHHDWGCSSLHEWTDDVTKHWSRNDFHFNDKCEVETIRLDTFIETHGITEIEHLWIDTQGNDFSVLKSLGEKVSIVKAGNCEVVWGLSIYKNTNNNVEDVVKWLIDNGFTVTSVNYDSHAAEADIHFIREEDE